MRVPVIGIVPRFAAQKGFDLIAQIMERLAREEMINRGPGYAIKLMKKCSAPGQAISSEDCGPGRLRQHDCATRLKAAATCFLMPSKYEPCGLNPDLQPEIWTVPNRPRTGGLDDTIEHWDPRTGKGTGFQVHRLQRRGFLLTIRKRCEPSVIKNSGNN